MIKAEDLRIGDLVKVRKGYVFTEGEICKVVATESCSLGKKMEGGCITLKGLSWGEFTVGYCKNYREIDPITLTPEILEKNGFEVEYPGKRYKKPIGAQKRFLSRCLSIEYRPTEWKVFMQYNILIDHMLLRSVKHVHELQHILWALGEDANLKI